MSRFLEVLHSGRVLLMDGAMGTELQRLGLKPDENATAWTLLYPERVRQVHQAYREAGAQVFLTNTFLAACTTLADTLRAAHRLPYVVHELWTRDYELIGPRSPTLFRLAVHGPVAGPIGPREFEQLAHFYSTSLVWDGADGILFETCSSPRVRYPLRTIRHRCVKPILLSLAYRRGEHGELVTASGHPPEWFAVRAKAWGLAALGVNCGRDIGMDEIIEIIRRYRRVTDLPLFARPNAGTPTRRGKCWVYPHTPQEMAARLPELLEAGVCMVGGCCGTTPEHMAAFKPVIDAWNERRAER